MSVEPFPLSYTLTHYKRLLNKLSLFMLDGYQKPIYTAIIEYSHVLHELNKEWEVLPIVLKHLNEYIISLLKETNDVVILRVFNLEMQDLKYA